MLLGLKRLAALRRRGKATELPTAVAESERLLGEHCGRLLADPVLQLVFELVEEELTAQLLETALGERDGREALYLTITALKEVEARMRSLLGDANTLAAEERRRRAVEERRTA